MKKLFNLLWILFFLNSYSSEDKSQIKPPVQEKMMGNGLLVVLDTENDTRKNIQGCGCCHKSCDCNPDGACLKADPGLWCCNKCGNCATFCKELCCPRNICNETFCKYGCLPTCLSCGGCLVNSAAYVFCCPCLSTLQIPGCALGTFYLCQGCLAQRANRENSRWNLWLVGDEGSCEGFWLAPKLIASFYTCIGCSALIGACCCSSALLKKDND
ncbi:MAG: hypothetical protein UR26_C0002G0139 [candidate division TM6 bacterium GW2011_GWF2_32_72]|nr:MAG: hypothetical protein UR26_C0002G0139 [candidate division TM6 bacterium GW2011_GWF2_32_72]